MGKVPANTAVEAPRAVPAVKAAAPKPVARRINCFLMDQPGKPGLLLVSTGKTQDGCYVLGWQAPTTTLLVSEGPQWYEIAGKMFKAQLFFSGVFAFCLLVVLVLNRVR